MSLQCVNTSATDFTQHIPDGALAQKKKKMNGNVFIHISAQVHQCIQPLRSLAGGLTDRSCSQSRLNFVFFFCSRLSNQRREQRGAVPTATGALRNNVTRFIHLALAKSS